MVELYAEAEEQSNGPIDEVQLVLIPYLRGVLEAMMLDFRKHGSPELIAELDERGKAFAVTPLDLSD